MRTAGTPASRLSKRIHRPLSIVNLVVFSPLRFVFLVRHLCFGFFSGPYSKNQKNHSLCLFGLEPVKKISFQGAHTSLEDHLERQWYHLYIHMLVKAMASKLLGGHGKIGGGALNLESLGQQLVKGGGGSFIAQPVQAADVRAFALQEDQHIIL